MKEKTPVIHLIDDDTSFRMALMRLLRAAGYETRSYVSATDFLNAGPFQSHGCIILDMQMPGMGGLELQQVMNRLAEPLPVIFLTAYGDIPASVKAIKAGAVDFLTKPVSLEVLLPAIESALKRDAEMRLSYNQIRRERARYALLTSREAEVFKLVVAGKLNKQIAVSLNITERTVKAHRANVMKKMQVKSLADLVWLAGLLGVMKS